MATISSAGIGSGIDIESLISRLVAAERTPINQLKTRTDGLKTQLSAIGKTQSQLSALRDAANKLARADIYTARRATSSDLTQATVSASSAAVDGNYSLNVTRLAQTQSLASAAVPSGSSIGSGTMTITFGRYSADLATFDADPTRTSLVIPIITGSDQLERVRDQINALKSGVVASVVSDVNGTRLVMRGTESGQANGFQVSVADDDGNSTDANGLSRLAFDPTNGVNAAALKQAAGNALLNLNGVDIESASNQVEGAVEGLSIKLLKTGASTLTVSQDGDALKKAVTDFVSAYNDTLKLVRDQTRIDPANARGGGPLKGDSTLNGIQNQLRILAGSSTTLGGSLARLADLGLDPASDGSLKINATKLDAALAKPEELRAFFGGVDSSNAANSGFAVRLDSLLDGLLDTDGRLDARQKGIQSRIDTNGKRESALELRMQLVEKRLREQYTSLDATMSKASSLSAYLNNQLGKL